LGFLAIYEFVINSDNRKTISQRLLTFFIWFEVHIQPFLRLKILQISEPCNSQGVNYSFKSIKKLNHDILDSVDKPKIVRSCIFPLANLYFEQSVDYVP
jgi:hypothetical protein